MQLCLLVSRSRVLDHVPLRIQGANWLEFKNCYHTPGQDGSYLGFGGHFASITSLGNTMSGLGLLLLGLGISTMIVRI